MRIVIVSYHFTPSTMVAALRARGLAKYLARAGHSVTVVTAEPAPETAPEWDVVALPGETFSGRIRRVLGVSQHHTVVDALSGGRDDGLVPGTLKAARRALRELFFWPDEAAGWSRRVTGWLDDRIAAGAVDLVISTSPPASAHVAVLRSHRRGVPWVADYRDLWTRAHHYPLSPARRALDARLEARVALESDAITTATEGFARTMRQAFPDACVTAVYNGYDPELFTVAPRRTADRRLTLVHAGSLYGGRVDPAVLFEALGRLVSDARVPADGLHLDLYCAKEGWLDRSVAAHGLEGIVTVHGTRPRADVIEAYAGADVLVLLQWDDPGEADVLPAKMLEYLASGRSILAVGSRPGSEVDRMLASTGAGTIVGTVEETALAVARLYDEFARTGGVSVATSDADRAAWTQEAMALAMERAMREAAERSVRRTG